MTWHGVYCSYPGWNQPSPPFDTREEADQWWKSRVSMGINPKDWGYSYAVDDAGNPIKEDEATRHNAHQIRVPTNPATLLAKGEVL